MKKRKKTTMWVRWSKKAGMWLVKGCWCGLVHDCSDKEFAVWLGVNSAKQGVGMVVWDAVELRICRKDGSIQESRTYPRSADPRRSKG